MRQPTPRCRAEANAPTSMGASKQCRAVAIADLYVAVEHVESVKSLPYRCDALGRMVLFEEFIRCFAKEAAFNVPKIVELEGFGDVFEGAARRDICGQVEAADIAAKKDAIAKQAEAAERKALLSCIDFFREGDLFDLSSVGL